MYFFTLEVYDDMIPQFVESVPLDNICKFVVISHDYQFDIDAQGYVEEILVNVLLDEQLNELQLNYNPDFFPESVIESQFIEEDFDDLSDEELEQQLQLLDEQMASLDNISIDGLPEQPDINLSDLTLNTYTYIDQQMESLKLNASVMINMESYQFIDFNKNTTVH